MNNDVREHGLRTIADALIEDDLLSEILMLRLTSTVAYTAGAKSKNFTQAQATFLTEKFVNMVQDWATSSEVDVDPADADPKEETVSDHAGADGGAPSSDSFPRIELSLLLPGRQPSIGEVSPLAFSHLKSHPVKIGNRQERRRNK